MAVEQPRSQMPLALRLVLAIIGGLVSAVVAAGAFLLFGAVIGPTEPVDRSTQPLEVVVDSESGCQLNVDAVAPGQHEVAVIAVKSASVVTITDPSGAVVLRAHSSPSEGGLGQHSVRLALGTYGVRCRSSEGTDASVTLPVRPASELE